MSQIEALSSLITTSNTQAQVATESAVKSERKEVKDDDAKSADVVNINEALSKANALSEIRREERQVNIDEDLGRLVVKIINSDTKEILRQLPTEEALALSKRMQNVLKVMYG